MMEAASPTRDLAKWIVSDFDGEQFSDRQRAIASMSVVDTLACMFAGTCEPGMRVLGDWIASSPDAAASMIGCGTGAAAADAVMLNGYLAHVLDYDDSDLITRSHPSCVLVPVTFALAEEMGLSARRMLDAYLVGLQVNQMIGYCATPLMPQRGYHVVGAAGIMGGTAAASRLLGLDTTQTARAMGIAGSMAAGLRASFGTDIKAFHAGRSASGAIQAAQLAKRGFTAPETTLEAKDGYLWTLAGPDAASKVRGEVDRLLAGEFSIEKAPPVIKLYPCNHAGHAPIEAILKIRPKVVDRLDSIREIVIECPHTYDVYQVYEHPRTGLEAKFSHAGCVVIPLLDGKAGVGQFTDESVQRPSVQAMLGKVSHHSTDAMQAKLDRRQLPAMVTVVTDTETYVEDVEDIRGTWANPCEMDDILTKLSESGSGVIPAGDLAELRDMCGAFAEIADVRRLSRLVRGTPARA